MGVLRNDFATVDFDEELCQTQLPEKAKSKRTNGSERKTNGRREALRAGVEGESV